MKNLFDIKTYMVFLSRNKAYSFINVLGLSVGFAFVILIGLFAQRELSIDSDIPNADRIYVMGSTLGYNGLSQAVTGQHWKIQPRICSRYPEIETTCTVGAQNGIISLPDGSFLEVGEMLTDSTFYRIFGNFTLTIGNKENALDNINSVIISEEVAKRIFGNENPMGQTLNMEGNLNVTGVFDPEEFDKTCLFKPDIICRYENCRNYACLSPQFNNAIGAEVFILTKPSTDLPSKVEDMDEYFSEFLWLYQEGHGYDTKTLLVPLDKLYLTSDVESANGITKRGQGRLVKILLAVALVILLFSVFNYINLTVAQSTRRAKEMATRRLVGSQRGGIIVRLLSEAVLICLICMVLAVVLAYCAAPAIGSLLESELQRSTLLSPSVMLLLVAAAVVIGIVAGLIPALIISRAKPVEIVRGTFRMRTKMAFSKVFIVLQNVATIVLIAVSLTMILQTRHLLKAPLGFNTENIMDIDLPNVTTEGAHRTFVTELRKLPCVVAVSPCRGTPKGGGNNNTVAYDGKAISFQELVGESEYFDIFGITLLQDNHIGSDCPYGTDYWYGGDVYVNMQALTEMGLDRDARSINPYRSWGNDKCKPMTIRGIVNDFNIRGISEPQHPLLIWIFEDGAMTDPQGFNEGWEVAIKVTGDPAEAYKAVQKVYKDVYRSELVDDMPFIDQMIQDDYKTEIRFSKMLSLFAAIAVLISFLGLVAMSTYFISQRRKEIAVRKVMGSTSSQVMKRLVSAFMAYVLVAFVISVPLIWYIAGNWLSDFSYRISLSPWIFIAAGVFAVLISLAAVVFQSWAAASSNPVDGIAENQ